MRLWSLHPCYLDAKGLVALWREALLAQKVLQGGTRGYTRHPQLTRFRETENPLAAIASYLRAVNAEASARGYHFDYAKIAPLHSRSKIAVTSGQIACEFEHLKRKLKIRDREKSGQLNSIDHPRPHPLFRIVPGAVAEWERA